MFNRRSFIKVAGLTSLISLNVFPGPHSSDQIKMDISKDFFRAVQGSTDNTSTIISILTHKENEINFEIKNSRNQSLNDFEVRKIDLNLSEYIIYQIYSFNLNLNTTYHLKIFDNKKNILKSYSYKALDLANKDSRIAILSCSNHRDAAPMQPMFKALFSEKPDALFFIGDLVYANSALDTALGRPATPAAAYQVFVKTLTDFPIYSQNQLTPIFSSFDDHDFGYNNSDSTHPNLQIMQKICRTFFPIDSRTSIQKGPGLSFHLEAFGFNSLFLDTRSFKNTNQGAFLGREQFEWAEKIILDSTSPLFLLGTQQFWNYRSLAESYQKDSAAEFNSFLKLIQKAQCPVVFASGDVHYSQVQTIHKDILNYKTFEITSSAFFSSSAGSYGQRSAEDGQLEYYGKPNFLMLDKIDTTGNTFNFSVKCVSEKMNPQFKYDVKVNRSV